MPDGKSMTYFLPSYQISKVPQFSSNYTAYAFNVYNLQNLPQFERNHYGSIFIDSVFFFFSVGIPVANAPGDPGSQRWS
jgi:hypothetical protein